MAVPHRHRKGVRALVPPSEPENPRIKVAVLVGALEVGGAELDIVRNFPRLNRDEFDVVVVSFSTKGVLGPELERLGIPVIARCEYEHQSDESPPQRSATHEFLRRVPGLRPTYWFLWRVIRIATLLPRWAVSSVLNLPPLAWLRRRIGTMLYMATVMFWVGRVFRSEKIDVAHFFLPHAYAYGMFACLLMRPSAARVMSRLSLNFYTTDQPLLAWLERNVLHDRVDIAIGNSVKILDELVEEGVNRSKTRLLYNGIDPTPFDRHDGDRERARAAMGLPQDAFVVAAVGNLHSYKGHRDLIEACAAVGSELPQPWRVLVAGRDETGNRAVYLELIERHGLAENIRLLGPCDDVPRLLSAADVFVHPSHHEGLPNAIIEAMAASLPVIGTAVGGIPELVTPVGDTEETGWVVPPHEPAGFGRTLIEAATDPQLREAMGIRARARVEARFSLRGSVDSYEEIYREIMHSKTA